MNIFKNLLKKDSCQKCGSTKQLHRIAKWTNKDGTVRQAYYCRECTRARANKYYHAGNQKRFYEANKRYLDKKKATA